MALCVVGALGFSIGPALWLTAKAGAGEGEQGGAGGGATTLTTKSNKPLPAQAAIRGQYMNIGSKDIGPDLTDYSKRAASKKDKDAKKKTN